MTEFQAYILHQHKVKHITDSLTGDESITLYNGCIDKMYVTILKVDDREYKWTQEVI